jgi:hypothetical protein
MEVANRQPEASRIPTHLVEGEETDVAVESGVFDPLRHHRAGGLLEADHEVARVRARIVHRRTHGVG